MGSDTGDTRCNESVAFRMFAMGRLMAMDPAQGIECKMKT